MRTGYIRVVLLLDVALTGVTWLAAHASLGWELSHRWWPGASVLLPWGLSAGLSGLSLSPAAGFQEETFLNLKAQSKDILRSVS